MEWQKDGLKVRLLGYWPKYELKNNDFINEVGADTLIAFLQKAVSEPVSFSESVKTEIESAMTKNELDDIVLKKICSSVLRGHSLDGTAGIVLGIEGSKFIDPALTGLVNSRSFTTSGRRALIEDIIVPEIFNKTGNELLKTRYVEIAQQALQVYKNIVETFGEKQGPQIASKMMAYNSSGNLYIVLPVSAIVTLSNELEYQREEGKIFFPREIENLVDIIEKEIVKTASMKKIYNARKIALRDTYLHWNVFKAPKENLAIELVRQYKNPLTPYIVNYNVKTTTGFLKKIIELEKMLKDTCTLKNPKDIERNARKNLLAFRDFVDRYNDSVYLQTISSLSWRVWGEQKRHATLKQCVESIYMAAEKAYEIIEPLKEKIENCKESTYLRDLYLRYLIEKVEQAIVIPRPLKQEGKEKLLLDYIDASAKQIIFMKYLIQKGIEPRDAIYILPRCVRVRTLETYDLYNLTLGELSLRLCTTCEPERLETTEIKENLIKETVPELKNLIGPKCNLGYCSETNYCQKIIQFNPNYNKDIHNVIREILVKKVKNFL
ncbi:MAG: hypothetical protein N3G19_00740 [Candidatus Pacearchaeota archaeon]|nr:hypothetical protein [Candidatus Pacearchaeota archaeon]